MKNKKGFTLVELLAVIVILGVVLTIGGVSINGVRMKIEKNMFENKLNSVINSAKNYGLDNKEEILSSTNSATIGDTSNVKYILKTVKSLIEEDYLECEETVSKSDLISGESCISVNADSCRALSYYEDDKSINMLNVAIYIKNNRIYACIPANSSYFASGVVANNISLLHEDGSLSKFKDLHYYCN